MNSDEELLVKKGVFSTPRTTGWGRRCRRGDLILTTKKVTFDCGEIEEEEDEGKEEVISWYFEIPLSEVSAVMRDGQHRLKIFCGKGKKRRQITVVVIKPEEWLKAFEATIKRARRPMG